MQPASCSRSDVSRVHPRLADHFVQATALACVWFLPAGPDVKADSTLGERFSCTEAVGSSTRFAMRVLLVLRLDILGPK